MSGKEYYNFLVLGAEATGKTCLCSCFSRGLFLDQHVPTIDVPAPPFCRASAACVVPPVTYRALLFFSYFSFLLIHFRPTRTNTRRPSHTALRWTSP